MSDDPYHKFYALLEQKTGISLDDTKQYLVDARLATLQKDSGMATMVEFLARLVSSPVSALHWQALEALTTNETMFFRDRAFFDALAKDILPGILRSKGQERTLRICCAAVSTGQEAYSLVMLLKQQFPELNSWDVYIQASDICNRALERARAGVYSATEVERGLDPSQIQRYFSKTADGKYEVLPLIRDGVSFLPANLLDPAPAYPRFDLILLRNVLIYFSQATKDRVLDKMRRQLNAPDGLLALGSTESILSGAQFKLVRYGKISCFTVV
jgi:chemotaxis protein methyltransferase CheR